MGDNRILINVIDTTWRPDFAYAVGLIASDGCLRKDTMEVRFVSKELEMIRLYRKSLGIDKRARKYARGGETEKKYYDIFFKSKQFHTFLRGIGIHPQKSKTIQAVDVPDKFFADFFRGLFDGDGTFWTTWDKRWPSSFVFILGISSASLEFIHWLKSNLSRLYGVKGYIHTGDGAYTIRYVKRDSRKLFEMMYYKENLLFLSRKYNKIKAALDFDEKLKQRRNMPW